MQKGVESFADLNTQTALRLLALAESKTGMGSFAVRVVKSVQVFMVPYHLQEFG